MSKLKGANPYAGFGADTPAAPRPVSSGSGGVVRPVRLNVDISQEERQQLRMLAAEENTTVAEIIRGLIAERLARRSALT